jgi:hypothetical protein
MVNYDGVPQVTAEWELWGKRATDTVSRAATGA